MLLSNFYFTCFFSVSAPSEIYTLSLHDALPIFAEFLAAVSSCETEASAALAAVERAAEALEAEVAAIICGGEVVRSEEHTSELQSRQYLVCRLLLEKKKYKKKMKYNELITSNVR